MATTIGKRLFLWWLRVTRPAVYERFIRFQIFLLIEDFCAAIPPMPVTKETLHEVLEMWRTDDI